jgi:hypothetical protein
MRTSRLAVVVAAAIAVLATVDAAGATAPPTSDPVAAAFEFAQCMRDNGIVDFPDPQISAR